ncbi:cache domain-containing protein [Streptomyces sp. NPDC005811]|uniref:cache domain-containing protein n=1 Tax=Streptomyces sp. NPDC005811 TaxID=3154565 RepID=UPI0033ED8AC9
MSLDELDVLLAGTAGVIAERIDAAFEDVVTVRRLVSDIADRAAGERKPLDRAALTGIRALVRELLDRRPTLLEGLGVAVGEDSLSDTSQWSEWWRRDATGQAYFIRHVLNPDSIGFYDYQSRDWFRLPTSTVRTCAVGPYVDAGGIEVSTVTLCVPVVFPSGAVSVVGGDLSIPGVEALLLRTLATRSPRIALLAANGRVVASNTARHVVGSRVRVGDRTLIERSHPLPSADPERIPWRLVTLRDT